MSFSVSSILIFNSIKGFRKRHCLLKLLVVLTAGSGMVVMPGCGKNGPTSAEIERINAGAQYRNAYAGWMKAYGVAASIYKSTSSPTSNGAFGISLQNILISRQSFQPSRRSERFANVDSKLGQGFQILKDAMQATADGTGTQAHLDQANRWQDMIIEAENEFVKAEQEFLKEYQEIKRRY